MIGRAHIEPDNVAHLGDEQRVGGELEGLGTVRLQAEGAPDALHARGGDAAAARHRSRAPMGGALRHGLQSGDDQRLHLGIVDRARHARPRLVIEAVKPLGKEAASPFADGLRCHPKLRRYRLIGFAGRTGKHDPSAQGQSLCRRPPARQAHQGTLFFRAEVQRCQWTTNHDLPSSSE